MEMCDPENRLDSLIPNSGFALNLGRSDRVEHILEADVYRQCLFRVPDRALLALHRNLKAVLGYNTTGERICVSGRSELD